MNKFVFAFFIILSLSSSCNLKSFDKGKILRTILTESKKEIRDYKAIVIIPLEGCGTCYDISVSFMTKNINNQEICFIISHYSPVYGSIKSIIDMNNGNVIDNYNSDLIQSKLVGTTPVVYFVNEGELIEERALTKQIDYTVFISFDINIINTF